MICLTFDTDHLDAARMEEFLSEVPIPGRATFFCTERYPTLEGGAHEICPHPDFQPGSDWDRVLDEARNEYPDARGVRTHTTINSHILSIEFGKRDFEWISSRDEPGRRGITPYCEAWGVWHVPIYYMDNMDFSYADYWPGTEREPFSRDLLETALSGDGVYVFDFHPIHLMLNTSSATDYLARRDRFKSGEDAGALRFEGRGAREFYEELVGMMEEAGVASRGISETLEAATPEADRPPTRG